MKYRNMRRFLGLQFFADGDGGGTGGDGGDGGGSGAEGQGDDGGGDSDKPLSFDDFLKLEGNQGEFDRRVQKAISTAVKNAQEKWQALTDDKLSEAEKLAKMTAAEREQYKRDKERREFEAEKAEFEKEKLLVEVTKQLTEAKLPTAFADSLAASGDAEKIKESIKSLKEVWDTAISEAIKAKARQTPPDEGGGAQGNTRMSIGKMAKAARIIKN